jgi:hypothetical protein
LDGQIHLAAASSVFKDGVLFLWNDSSNTALGRRALGSNTTGANNTASGLGALLDNTTGSGNTATGAAALSYNADGSDNTATGRRALFSNTLGSDNTATGSFALYSTVSGRENTATGDYALYSTTGLYNTATGAHALRSNGGGFGNTATGIEALYSNVLGSNNTATGRFALRSNTGINNTATGRSALVANTTGANNTAIGVSALANNTTGSRNVAIGYEAGASATGDDNILISNKGVDKESGTIRIGDPNVHTGTFVAGISGTSVSGSTVMVNGVGQLGVSPSARRYKEDIRDLGHASSGVLNLRPVTFRYKEGVVEGPRPVEFGLIAEEVAELYPDLVVYDEEGRPYSVRYHLLSPMLLNELQKQQRRLGEQEELLERLRGRLARLEAVEAKRRSLDRGRHPPPVNRSRPQ